MAKTPLNVAAVRSLCDADPSAPLTSGAARILLDEIDRLTAELGQRPQPYEIPQRKPVCATCFDSVIWVAGSGWGTEGEWRHLAPPRTAYPEHDPKPKVFVTPPQRLNHNAGNESGQVHGE